MNQTKTVLPGVSSKTWEHPADKAAMTALHAIPGLDFVAGKILGATVDRYVRMQFLSSAVRVGPRQFSRLHSVASEVFRTLDASKEYESFVAYNPAANAGVYGFEKPVMVFHSSILDVLNDEELAFVVAHELGHAESGHALYHTLLTLLINGWQYFTGIGLTEIARMAIVLALLEWYRKSELSADRAGLLGVQDPQVVWSAFMKMAGGPDASQMNVDDFLQQALDYDKAGDAVDELSKLMILSFRSHPMPVLRLKELKVWHDSGAYQRILDGEYPRRTSGGEKREEAKTDGAAENGAGFRANGDSAQRRDGSDVFKDMQEAVRHYAQEIGQSPLVKGIGEGLGKAAKDLDDFFKGGKG